MTAELDRFVHLDGLMARKEARREQLYADLHDAEVEEAEARTVLLRMAQVKLSVWDEIRTVEREMATLDTDRRALYRGEFADQVAR